MVGENNGAWLAEASVMRAAAVNAQSHNFIVLVISSTFYRNINCPCHRHTSIQDIELQRREAQRDDIYHIRSHGVSYSNIDIGRPGHVWPEIKWRGSGCTIRLERDCQSTRRRRHRLCLIMVNARRYDRLPCE